MVELKSKDQPLNRNALERKRKLSFFGTDIPPIPEETIIATPLKLSRIAPPNIHSKATSI